MINVSNIKCKHFICIYLGFFMANRSKKTVLSVRIAPYLKASLDIIASYKNKKLVAVVETLVEKEVSDFRIDIPEFFDKHNTLDNKMSLGVLMSGLWTDDEVLFKLRLGVLREGLIDEYYEDLALFVITDPEYQGDIPLFGNYNKQKNLYNHAEHDYFINLDKIKADWLVLQAYITFLNINKPLELDYEDYKKMIGNAKQKK